MNGPFNRFARPQADLRQTCNDVVRAAEIAQAPFDRERLWQTLKAYSQFFSESTVSFVTNTEPVGKRRLHVRYIELEREHDPFAIAQAEGFIVHSQHAINEAIPALQRDLRIWGYGVDVDASYGLSKIWVFFRDLPTAIAIAAMPFLPASFGDAAEYFLSYGLEIVNLLAFDFHHKSTNIYFMRRGDPNRLPPDSVARMLAGLGLELPLPEILNHCSRALTIYPTLSWESAGVQRLCFGIPAFEPNCVPVHWHPLLARYVSEAPTLRSCRSFIYGITMGLSGTYVKLENDYSGSMAESLVTGAALADSISR